jgi:hypothetical protein
MIILKHSFPCRYLGALFGEKKCFGKLSKLLSNFFLPLVLSSNLGPRPRISFIEVFVFAQARKGAREACLVDLFPHFSLRASLLTFPSRTGPHQLVQVAHAPEGWPKDRQRAREGEKVLLFFPCPTDRATRHGVDERRDVPVRPPHDRAPLRRGPPLLRLVRTGPRVFISRCAKRASCVFKFLIQLQTVLSVVQVFFLCFKS